MTRTRGWQGLVFIGTSVDGRVARSDGTLDWLLSRGEAAGDTGYAEHMARVDAILMGRNTYDVVRRFEPWPFDETFVAVLSTTLESDSDERVHVVRGLDEAVALFDDRGARGVYIDGGATISACLAAGLVDEMTISQVPVLIGDGIPLFGSLPHDVDLAHTRTRVLGGGMVQTTYTVNR